MSRTYPKTSIAANEDFKNAAMALHYNWTPEGVHKLIDIVDQHAAAEYARGRGDAVREYIENGRAAEQAEVNTK